MTTYIFLLHWLTYLLIVRSVIMLNKRDFHFLLVTICLQVIAPFDLVHLDTWGPFQVPIVDGHRFCLTIVGDCPRATWSYLMKTKSDVLYIFPNFYTHILT